MPFNVVSLRRQHEHVLALTQRAVDEVMKDAAEQPQRYVREHPNGFKHRTGKLIRATKGRVVRVNGKTRVIVSNSRKYAAALDEGSKPHVIRPRKKKFLRFSVGGRIVFAKSVKHPGTKATHFLYRATNASARIAFSNLEHRLARIARDRH